MGHLSTHRCIVCDAPLSGLNEGEPQICPQCGESLVSDGDQTIESVFQEALTMDPVERSAFLDRVCHENPSLRDRLDQLIQFAERDDSLLDLPDTRDPTTEVPRLDSPETRWIGDYKLIAKLGEGGMGSVFLAEQHRPVQRMVALKIVRAGLNSKQIVARFETERQSLALMEHPNIAKVLDAGETNQGEPFFVMEHIRGTPITTYCKENRLPTRKLLGLMIDVCNAVQHAHQKGIIHRDLKPSNILVAQYDDQPVPKVIDFGVAKATHQKLTEKTLHTQIGQIVGTLEYMSPEQAILNQLDVDTRSDVYSLGVVLYELLVGQTPLDAKDLRSGDLSQTLRVIQEKEPPRPSLRLSSQGEAASQTAAYQKTDQATLSRALKGDLDWIVMKALEKERKRRYGSPARFAEDIQRYLNGEPIEARPPSFGYRFGKFVNRRRIPIAVLGALFFAVCLGIGGVLWQAAARWRLTNRLLEDTKERTWELALIGDLSGAEHHRKMADALGADDAWVMLRKAQIAMHRGDYSDASEDLAIAARQMPGSLEVQSLSIICDYFAGYEHKYFVELGGLRTLRPNGYNDLLFRGLAQTWANPRRAVDDLENAIEERPHLVAGHLMLSRVLRLLAADTVDHANARDIAQRARREALVSKTLLPTSTLAYAEYIHTGTILANVYNRLGAEYEAERNQVIDDVKQAVEESATLPYTANLHRARFYFWGQVGDADKSRAELFEGTPPRLGNHESDSVVAVRRVWTMLREENVEHARTEYRTINDTDFFRDNSLVPFLIDLWKAAPEDLPELRTTFRDKIEDSSRDGRGVYAHHDWCIARLLQLDDVELDRARQFKDLVGTLDLEHSDDYHPMAKYMQGEPVDIDQYLANTATSNRAIVESCFLLGIDQVAKGNRKRGAEYFRQAIETDYYQFFVYWWSVAFLEKLDDKDWMPWL